ncbi:MAG: M50 family metallopeptidase, partial [Candidatus Aenigmatarchaeota archaeon]
ALIGIKNPYVEYRYKGFLSKYGHVSPSTLSLFQWIEGLFYWIFILNVGVGVFNLFPLKPLDGGLMFEAVCEHFFKKKSKRITTIVSVTLLILILFNIFGPSLLKLIS